MDILQLAKAFRSARFECRLTQKEVARGAGLSVVTVSRFERGELLEIGVVKLLNLFNQVGLELYPRPLGHLRTLDDIQRERSTSSASLGLRAAIGARGNPNIPRDSTPASVFGQRAAKTSLEKNAPAIQRVRHSKGEKTRG